MQDENFAIQRRRIHEKMSHPNYTEGQPYFDVAVVLMERSASIGGSYIRQIGNTKHFLKINIETKN